MKTVGILTFHFVHNYGALLQAWALQTFLEQSGYDVQFINFRPREHSDRYSLKEPFFKMLHPGWIRSFSKNFQRVRTGRTFDRFIYRNVRQTRCFLTHKKIAENPPAFDFYIAGSDQIWNDGITGKISTYYLDFVQSGKKIAWAASLSDTVSDFQRECFKRFLPVFSAVTLREKQHADFIADVSGKEISVVLDPVFLPDLQNWIAFSEKSRFKFQGKSYILVYCLGNQQAVTQEASRKAKQLSVPVYSIHPFNHPFPGADKTLCSTGPHEFVYLIRNAACVVTDSFHATAFSVLFNTPLVTLPPEGNAGRIHSLLEELQLSDSEQLETGTYTVVNLEKRVEADKQILLAALT